MQCSALMGSRGSHTGVIVLAVLCCWTWMLENGGRITLPVWTWVALGGALGTLARWQVGLWCQKTWPVWFPWGVWIPNVLGCLLIGIVWAVVETYEGSTATPWYALTTIGFLGAFTTFSTLMVQTGMLWKDHSPGEGVVYLGATLLGGALCVILGYAAMGWWLHRGTVVG